MIARLRLAGALALLGCGPAEEIARAPAPEPSVVVIVPAPPPVAASSVAPVSPAFKTDADDPELRAVLERVSTVRRLPIKEHVRFARASRQELREKTEKKMREEIPAGVIEAQGESLRALGLAPIEYEFERGILKLIAARVAGFYDPDERALFLLDDLGDSQEEDTLAHELAHALQDQSFSIGPLLDYKAGQSDRQTAIQLLVEGDATSAGFEVTYGTAFAVDERALRTAFVLSTAMSDVGAQTPAVLIASLVTPYTDGFSFVQALRAHGGWREVDAAFATLPESTEQTLHPEKYFVRERPVVVAEPTIAALGPGFRPILSDVNGELGLRLMLEQWGARRTAEVAAAGWGGDRFVVAKKDEATPGEASFAVAFVTRMDTQKDAGELFGAFERHVGKPCIERSDLGPLAIRLRRKDVVVVAGPYVRGPEAARSAATCAQSDAWIQSILRALPK